jgi:hypothetical protein
MHMGVGIATHHLTIENQKRQSCTGPGKTGSNHALAYRPAGFSGPQSVRVRGRLKPRIEPVEPAGFTKDPGNVNDEYFWRCRSARRIGLAGCKS